jgi:hypothetical protein
MATPTGNSRRDIQLQLLDSDVYVARLKAAGFTLDYRYAQSLRDLSASYEAIAKAQSTLDSAHAIVPRRL